MIDNKKDPIKGFEKKVTETLEQKRTQTVEQNTTIAKRETDALALTTKEAGILFDSEDIKDREQDRNHRDKYANNTYKFLKYWCITYWVFIWLYIWAYPFIPLVIAFYLGLPLPAMCPPDWNVIYTLTGIAGVVIGVYTIIIKGLFFKRWF